MKNRLNRRGLTYGEGLVYVVGALFIMLLCYSILNNVIANGVTESTRNEVMSESRILFNLLDNKLNDGYEDTISIELTDMDYTTPQKSKGNVLNIQSIEGNIIKIVKVIEQSKLQYIEEHYQLDTNGNIVDSSKPIYQKELEFNKITSMELYRPNEVCQEDSTGNNLSCVQASKLLQVELYHDSNFLNRNMHFKIWRVFYEGEQL